MIKCCHRQRGIAWIKIFACLLYNILLNSSQRKPHQPLLERVAIALERVDPLRNLLCYGSGACRILMWFVTIQPYYTMIYTYGWEFSPCWNGLAGFMAIRVLTKINSHTMGFVRGSRTEISFRNNPPPPHTNIITTMSICYESTQSDIYGEPLLKGLTKGAVVGFHMNP